MRAEQQLAVFDRVKPEIGGIRTSGGCTSTPMDALRVGIESCVSYFACCGT